MDSDCHLLQTNNFCLESEDIRNRKRNDHKCPLLEFVKYAQKQAGMKAKKQENKKSNHLND